MESKSSPRAFAASPVTYIYLQSVEAAARSSARKERLQQAPTPSWTDAKAKRVCLSSGDDFDRGELTLPQYMIAGATAGATEHLAMYPIDTIKTLLQASPSARLVSKNVFTATGTVLREHGIKRLYRGVGAVVSGAIPSHAAHFAALEYVNDALGGNQPGHQQLAHAGAGAVATMAHDAVITPLDVVKQRLQLMHSPYKGIVDCFRGTLKAEGLSAFFASYPTTVLMNIPMQAVNFATYETSKRLFSGPSGQHGVAEELKAGMVAGALAGLVSNPLDVIKTRIQTDDPIPGQGRPTFSQIAKSIHSSEGWRGFYRGTGARVLMLMPSQAICWTTYETMKKLLTN